MMTLEKFEEASELVKKVTNPTKLVFSEYLSTQTGAKVYLKPENMQHTGAYKIRGAYYKISTLTDEERKIFDVTGKLPDNFVMPEDKGIIVDISGGGLRLFSKKQYDADSIVNVSFPIQVGDRSRYMKLMAKVVMSMRNQNSDSVYDSRLQFVNMQKEDTEDIVKYVFAQQRMIRKKERGL